MWDADSTIVTADSPDYDADGGGPAPVLTSASLANATVGGVFLFQLTVQASANDGPTNFAATGLPAGLSLNPATGLISGTPAQVGAALVNVTAVNDDGTGTQTLVLVVYLDPADVRAGTVQGDGGIGTLLPSYNEAVPLTPDQMAGLALLSTVVPDLVTSLQKFGTPTVAVQSPLTANGSILNLVRGDDYRAADGRQIDLTFANAPVLTGGQANLLIGNVTIPGTVTGPASVRFEPTAAETGALLANGAYNALSTSPYSPAYKVQAVLADGHVVTLCTGTCKVL